MDIFKTAFKQYKRKQPPPDLSDVIDFKNFKSLELSAGICRIKLTDPVLPLIDGLLPVLLWKAYTLKDHPGFTFIENPFEAKCERYWVKRCVEDYSCPPHHSNLDAIVGPVARKPVCLSNISSEDRELLDKLHWVTLGVHHNWDTKVYCEDDVSPMPADLCILTQFIAATLGYSHFCPQAAILNFYHISSSLGGHVDNSEHDLTAPLISLSFGCSAVFLLGGPSKAIKPSAIYVDNGDIIVMSGSSRLSYHAVPRILRRSERSFEDTTAGDTEGVIDSDNGSTQSAIDNAKNSQLSSGCSWTTSSLHSLNTEISHCVQTLNWPLFHEFLSTTRLNINVRQVFHNI